MTQSNPQQNPGRSRVLRLTNAHPTVPSFQKSEEMMRGRTAKEYENYGELLYVEGKIQAELRRKLVEQKRAEEQQKEVQGLTLRPEIR